MHDTSYLGVYSIRLPNARGQMQKRMLFVWAEDSGKFRVQALDSAFQPVGAKKIIHPGEFKKNYVHEPSILAVPVSTSAPWRSIAGKKEEGKEEGKEKGKEEEKKIEEEKKAEGHLPLSSAIPGLSKNAAIAPSSKAPPIDAAAVQQTETYLRDFFSKTLKRVRFSKDRTAALTSLKTVVEVEEGIVQEHKFMFADFGVALRKNDLLELALACCKRVLDLSPNDDHAHFNIARVFLAMNKHDDAEQHILTAQSINPSEIIYTKMLDHMQTERRRRSRPQKDLTRATSGRRK